MQLRLDERSLGPLRARVVHDPSAAPGPVVVLLHGFGAPGHDLVPLAQHLAAPSGTRFVFPEAPLDLGPSFGGGRAWWMIDMLALQQAMATGAFRDLAETLPEGLDAAREQLGACLDAVDQELAPAGLVLGGFSQGAMLTMDYALHADRPLAGLLQLSGTVVALPEWRERFEARRGLPVAQSHGRLDPVLPYAGAEHLRALMEGAGWRVRFVPFDGGHEIPPPALSAAGELLTAVFPSAT